MPPAVHRRSGAMAVFDMADQKTVVISIINSLADADFPPAELKAADLVQFATGIDAFVLGHVFVFTITAWGGNHIAPRFGRGFQNPFSTDDLANES
jgi:hypothetical protein